MSHLSRRTFLLGTALFLAALTVHLAVLVSCNDTGTNPFAPSVSFRVQGVTAVKNTPMTPDTIVAVSSGGISGYSVSPALPAGLTLSAKGVISGTATVSAPAENYSVTATGPNGSSTVVITLCVSDSASVCQVGKGPFAPVIQYPGIAAHAGVQITPDTAIDSMGGAITHYALTSALPAGLTLNATTGVITGKVSSLLYPGVTDTVIATGPSGTGTAKVNICIGNDTAFCDTRAPQMTYAPLDVGIGPGFMWTTVNVPILPDTPVSSAGKVTTYSSVTALPPGITLDASTGVIAGTPTAVSPAKDYQIVANGFFGTDTEVVYIGVYPAGYPLVFLKKGEDRFENVCAGCHEITGKGSPGSVPPYYHSDFLKADAHRAIRIQLEGLPNFVDTATTIYVNGVAYVHSGPMPGEGSADSNIAGVLTFIRAMFIGSSDYISTSEVFQVRDSMRTACESISGCDTTDFEPYP